MINTYQAEDVSYGDIPFLVVWGSVWLCRYLDRLKMKYIAILEKNPAKGLGELAG